MEYVDISKQVFFFNIDTEIQYRKKYSMKSHGQKIKIFEISSPLRMAMELSFYFSKIIFQLKPYSLITYQESTIRV
jgi:hypothetical protein